MTECNYNHTQDARIQRPEADPEKLQEKLQEKMVYNWPDSLTIHHLITELASERAGGEMELETEGFRFSGSMYDNSPNLESSLQLAPGIRAAVDEAINGYIPSEALQDILDQEMRDLAGTARDLLPEKQWSLLTQAAREDLQRKIKDQAAGA